MGLADRDEDAEMVKDWETILEKHAVEEPEEPQKPAAEAQEPAEPTEESEETAESTDSSEPARDESGRFVKAQKEEKKPAGAPAEETPAAAASVPVASARDINRAPSTWKAGERALWDKVSPEVRAAIHRRESDMAAGVAQLQPDATFGRTVRQTLEPYRMLIEAEGGTPERAIADLLRTAAIFRTGTIQQKYQAVAQIGQQFGLDLTLFGRQQDPNNPQPKPATTTDPRVDQLLAHLQRQDSERVQRENAQLNDTVTAWMNEADKDGNPKRPYIADVSAEMSVLIPQLRNSNPHLTHPQVLDLSYERAIWANPETRALLQQKAAADLATQDQAENQTRVREAKRAASVNVPRRASLPTPGKPGRMEDTIAEEGRRLGLIT